MRNGKQDLVIWEESKYEYKRKRETERGSGEVAPLRHYTGEGLNRVQGSAEQEKKVN